MSSIRLSRRVTLLTRSRSGGLLDGQSPARVSHAPIVRANSWEDVSDLSASFGVVLDEWQEDVLQAALGERTDGRWAARMVGVSLPRQNGKSQLIVARALAGVFLFDEQLIMVSAHQQDTAREVFTRLVDILEMSPTLNARVDTYGKALGREYIRFKSGQVIRFKARSTGSGRGFSADCLLLDEAQILTGAAWAAILPTMSARPNPQVWLLGTPPTPSDDGEVFGRIRETAMSGRDSRLAYMEWSAESTEDIDDPVTWARANPAFPLRIGAEAIESERSSMSDEQFQRERLGIWDAGRSNAVIPRSSWDEVGADWSVAVDRLALGVEAGPDLRWASVALAGQRADGLWHVELDGHRDGGTAWVVPYVAALLGVNPGIRAVVVDAGSPSRALLDEFVAAGVKVTSPKVTDLGGACTRMLEAVVTGQVMHTRQPQLTSAVSVAGRRRLGDTGMWVFSHATTTSDITPIQAATLALWGAQTTTVRRPMRPTTSRKVVVL